MSSTETQRLALAGLAGGLVLNAIDTPWSVFVMLPGMHVFETAHGLSASGLTGPWFMFAHFAYMGGIAWLYGLLRERHGSGARTALVAGGVLFVLNRMFGIGNGFLGVLPFDLFWGFTISFAVGTALGSLVCARIMDAPVRRAA